MGVLMEEYERSRRSRSRTRALVAAAIVSGLGAWLAGPYGVLLIVSGEPFGWALAAAGAVLLAGCVVAIVGAARSRALPAPVSGRPDPRFDEPQPSPDPRGGFSMNGSTLGSH